MKKSAFILFVLALGLPLFHVAGLSDFATIEILKEYRIWILTQANLFPASTAVFFVIIYTMGAAFSLPISALLTVSGGYVFGQILGTAYSITAATAGACLVFFLAKSSLGDVWRTHTGHKIKAMESNFQKNAFYYLLFLRLVPIFPFSIVNIAPALLGISFRTYFLGTFFGMIPGTFIFATAGASMGIIFDGGENLAINKIFTPTSLTALVGIAGLTLSPIIYKKLTNNDKIHSRN